ncbi:MAG TPA: Wzz/FepE/Etk N-terminal domain-containing protein [Solirubrobacteraceae bacterium]|jgi:Mrp family chromosome partitioning ATPase|nr:Wzz/FepE/Etk N-terminal domain-containing protein [Solirubrobacteraceae bacterium]
MLTRSRLENEPEVLHYARVLRGRLKLIAACVVLAVGVAVVYAKLAPRRYRAQAQMLVSPASSSDVALSTLPVLHSSSEPTRDSLTAVGLMTTPQIAQATVSALHLNTSARELLANVSATPIGQSNLVSLQATAGSAARAQLIANGFAQQVLATRAAAFHAGVAAELSSLRAQLAAETPAQRAADDTLGAQISELELYLHRPDPTITLAAPASLPLGPYTPRTMLAIVAGLVVGLVLGIVGALAVDVFDPRLRREEQLYELSDARVLATIPRERVTSRGGTPLLPQKLSFPAREGYRTLQTILAGRAGNGPRAILVTGTAPREGKTTTSISLATALAQGGASVILIEVDLRRPSIADALGIEPTAGTEDLVAGKVQLRDALVRVALDGAEMSVLAVRRPSPRLAELLSLAFSARLVESVKQLAQFVVIDSPPVTAVVDALPLARFVDDVVIVNRLGISQMAKLNELCELLVDYGAPTPGFVVIGGEPLAHSPYYGPVGGPRDDAAEVQPSQSARPVAEL